MSGKGQSNEKLRELIRSGVERDVNTCMELSLECMKAMNSHVEKLDKPYASQIDIDLLDNCLLQEHYFNDDMEGVSQINNMLDSSLTNASSDYKHRTIG